MANNSHEHFDLTAKEYALLEYMARHAGTVLSRTQLSEHVWDMNFEPTSNVVDVYIGYLRNKLEGGGGPRLIHSVRRVHRVGYRLSARPPDEFD